MQLSLVDILRCPASHEETSLVLSVEAWSGQRVSAGLLGCPVCHARFPIHQGSVDFTGGASLVRPGGRFAPVDPMRLAAQLSLTEPGGVVLLTGPYGAAANRLADIADVTCIVVDAPVDPWPRVVSMEVANRLPLADQSLRGAAVDESRSASPFLSEFARCLQAGGRLVFPSNAPCPNGFRLIAQDELEAVVERGESIEIIPLRRQSYSR